MSVIENTKKKKKFKRLSLRLISINTSTWVFFFRHRKYVVRIWEEYKKYFSHT